MSRKQKVAWAQRLRARGLTYLEIAREMGVARSTASLYITDPDGSQLAARKDSYRGTCEDCGLPTDGSNGREAAPTTCVICHHERNAERNKELFDRNAEGQPHWFIAEEMGISEAEVSSVLDYYRRKKGLDIPIHRLGGGAAEREARRKQIVELRRQGCSNQEIAERLGYSGAASVAHAVQRMRKSGVVVPPATRGRQAAAA